jgi:hypothetical protein
MRRGTKRALLAIGILVALGAGAVVVLPPILFGDGVDYSQVVSIKTDKEYQDPALLERAFALPVATVYKNAGLDYQGNGSFCGPTSAVDVSRSLGQATDQAHVLDDTPIHSTFGVVFGGLTLDQEAELIRARTHKPVTVLRDLTLEQFRAELAHVNDPNRRYTVNFTRGPLFATGGGHHSPIGGYLADEDLVLILDVNAKYKPWLVKSERLFQALDTVDKASHKKRGLLRIDL